MKKHRDSGELNIRLLIVLIQLAEGPELTELLNECLNNRNTREILLGKVGECGECLLSCLPFLGHILTNNRSDNEKECHGNEGEKCEETIHLRHLENSKTAKKKCVKEHKNAVTKALLNGIKVVGVVGHHVSYLVLMVELLGKILRMVEHSRSQVGLHLNACAKEADTPEEAAEHHYQHDIKHGSADLVNEEMHIEGQNLTALHNNLAIFDAVNNHSVQLGNLQL